MKINIVGWYGAKNLGDESFREVFLRQMWQHELSFSALPQLDADAIILGGGGVVTEGYLTGLHTYTKPLYALGVDIAVNGKWWNKLRSLPFQRLYVRSKEYVGIASATASNIEYCPDLAFSLYEPRQLLSKRKLGINVSYELTGGIDHLAKTINTLKRDFDEIVFIVLYTGKNLDIEMAKRVAAECQCDCSIVTPTTPLEALRIMADMSFILSMRFHGIIFSTILGIPFLSLSNKGKCSLYCEQERLFGQHIELREMNDVKLLDRIGYLMDNKEQLRDILVAISQSNKQEVDRVFATVNAEMQIGLSGKI